MQSCDPKKISTKNRAVSPPGYSIEHLAFPSSIGRQKQHFPPARNHSAHTLLNSSLSGQPLSGRKNKPEASSSKEIWSMNKETADASKKGASKNKETGSMNKPGASFHKETWNTNKETSPASKEGASKNKESGRANKTGASSSKETGRGNKEQASENESVTSHNTWCDCYECSIRVLWFEVSISELPF